MNKMIALFFAAGFFALAGCVSIHSSAISDSPNGVTGSTIQATEQGEYGILHLSAPHDLTVKANQDLMTQCSSGRLSNVQTQLSSRDYFLIVQVYKVRATAVCQ